MPWSDPAESSAAPKTSTFTHHQRCPFCRKVLQSHDFSCDLRLFATFCHFAATAHCGHNVTHFANRTLPCSRKNMKVFKRNCSHYQPLHAPGFWQDLLNFQFGTNVPSYSRNTYSFCVSLLQLEQRRQLCQHCQVRAASIGVSLTSVWLSAYLFEWSLPSSSHSNPSPTSIIIIITSAYTSFSITITTTCGGTCSLTIEGSWDISHWMRCEICTPQSQVGW